MTTKQLLSSNSYIQYPRFLGSYIGVNEAVLLSALCDKDSLCEYTYESYNGWFYYIKDEIEIDTGLSDSQQRTALKSLINLHIVNTERHNCPSRVYYNIDTDILENVLNEAYNEYKAHKSQLSQNMTTSDSENMTTSSIKNRISTIDKNKKENNIKGTVAGASSKNHSQVYKKRESLNDDLESGKDIDEQKKDKKKSPKDKFRDECLDIIEKECAYKLYSTEVHDLLIQYFEFVSAVPLEKYNVAKRVKTVSVWKKKLDRLAELAEDEGYSPSDIIKQSLDKKQYVFYPIQSTYTAKNSNNKHEVMQDSVKTRTLEESKLAMKKKIEKGALLF